MLRFLTVVLILASGSGIQMALAEGSGFTKWWLAVIVLVFAGLLEVLRQYIGKELALGETETARMRQAFGLLRLAQQAMLPSGVQDEGVEGVKLLRANIMVPTDAGCGRLRIWTSFGMEGDNDRKLEITNGTGVAGWVFQREKKVCAFDLTAIQGDPRCRVDPEQAQTAVRAEVQSILCAPIFDEQTGPDMPDRVVKGVLCFDSDLSMEQVGFEEEDIQDFALSVADLLAVTIRR